MRVHAGHDLVDPLESFSHCVDLAAGRLNDRYMRDAGTGTMVSAELHLRLGAHGLASS